MPFQVSPGVNVSEIDLTTVVPAVSTTEGAIAGVFHWGPVDQRILIDSENNLVARFGKPSNHNAETFFTAANFLSYGNQLYVTRAANTTAASTTTVTFANGTTSSVAANVYSAYSAIAAEVAPATRTLFNIRNSEEFVSNELSYRESNQSGVKYVAKYPGSHGNSLRISQCDSTVQFGEFLNLAPNTFIDSTSSLATFVVGSNSVTVAVSNTASGSLSDALDVVNDVFEKINVGDIITGGNTVIGTQRMQVTSFTGVDPDDNTANLTSNSYSSIEPFSNATHYFTIINFAEPFRMSSNATLGFGITREWEYAYLFDAAPGTSTHQTNSTNPTIADELHVVVVDKNGAFSGVPGTILEAYGNLSRATDAKSTDGATSHYRTAINETSSYVWAPNARNNAAENTSALLAAVTTTTPLTLDMTGGSDGLNEENVPLGDLLRSYDQYASAEDVDVSFLLQGKARGINNGAQIANYLIQNVAEVRKDCIVFISPVFSTATISDPNYINNMRTFRNSLTSSSYAVLDSGYKYQYDRYNDVYRYIPLNGDTAGLCVRTDLERDPWFSPAGFNRGQVKNIIKLAHNPSKAERDVLYKLGINPVVTFPGQGTVLFGDKTLLAKPSAFDRINVRRLFIVLEKAIAIAAQSLLFEFNDDFTRSQFKNLVEPFLADIQGRRGVFDYKVVCDDSNNTAEVIDRQEFVGDIFIKPARSINFIQLNFVAVRTGVEFNEIVGNF
jgi:phage tail sheath protein FI